MKSLDYMTGKPATIWTERMNDMDIYTEVDYAGLLLTFAESLHDEGRHNQADILRDVSAVLKALQARVAELEAQQALITAVQEGVKRVGQ